MTTLMNDANNAGTLAPCKFCGTYPNPNDPSCATLEQAYARTEVRPFGCPYFTDSDRKMHPLSTPNATVEQREAIARALLRAEIQKYPGSFGMDRSEDFTVARIERHVDTGWRNYLWQADVILAVRLDEAAIRKDEREKLLNRVCESLFVIADGWKEQPGKEETATAVSNAAVFICGKERAIAIRNGGKQP